LSNPRRSITVLPSIATLEGDRGQPAPRYALPLDRPSVYQWVPGSTESSNGSTILGAAGGYGGAWLEVRRPDKGVDLDDADADVGIADGGWRIVPDSTLGDNRTLTLVTDGAASGDTITITRLDSEAFTLTVSNDGTSGGDLFVLPASERWWCLAYFDGTDWLARAAGKLP